MHFVKTESTETKFGNGIKKSLHNCLEMTLSDKMVDKQCNINVLPTWLVSLFKNAPSTAHITNS
jgi:hypothetical protein